MRANLLILSITVLFGMILWATLSGPSFIVGTLVWLFFIVITVGYSDTFVLYFLGAREVRSSDEIKFFESASQEAYKLSLPMPHLYYYTGSLERAFVLQRGKVLSLILSKSLLEKSSSAELSAIAFELLLQVKKGMAPKRTKLMFVLGFLAWASHGIMGVLTSIVPSKEIRQAADWFLNYLLHPWLTFLFRAFLGARYFRKLDQLLETFPLENDQLRKVGLRLIKPEDFRSFTTRKLMELSSSSRSRHFQHIMALEFLPHEWDYIFESQEILRAE